MAFLRRSYKRFEVNGQALVFKQNFQERFILKDISARGAGLVGNYPLNINEKITLIFQAPLISERPIQKEAKVTWCNKINDNLWEGGLDFGLDNMEDLF